MHPPFTVVALARRLGMSPGALYRALRNGSGPPFFRVGRRILIDRQALEDWIARGGNACVPDGDGDGRQA